MSPASQVRSVFPRRLRAARELRNLSQQELAAKARLQQAAVSLYESAARRPSLRNLRRLAEALEVTTDYLVGRAEHPELAPASDEPLFRDFGLLSAADRQLARELVAQLARRSTAKPDPGA